MGLLKIALLQIKPAGGIQSNIEKGIGYLRMAKGLGADMAVFPEMWNIGYDLCGGDAARLKKIASGGESSFTQAFSDAAREMQMAVAVTFLRYGKDGLKNSVALYDRFGKRALLYSKVHTCDFGEERILTRGNSFPVATLCTSAWEIKAGAMICYDREFPESARILMLKGAELLIVPNACPMEINRLSQLRSRAFENMVAVATCNYPEGVADCNGRSSVFSGMVFSDDGRDMCLLQADGAEGLFIAELDLDRLREYRLRETWGNAYRRPELYGELISSQINSPFLRSDRKK